MTGTYDPSAAGTAHSPEFHRERLSAMLDGALSADETRFLLRRMQHDDELADCWERWQFYGDAMRGHAGRALPADFSRRVGRAIADDLAAEQAEPVAATSGGRRPLLRWGGGAALAASVALAALFVGRDAVDGEPAPAAVASTAVTAPTPTPPVPAGMPIPQPVGSSGVVEPAAAVAAATVVAAAAADAHTRHPRMLAADRAVNEGQTRALTGITVRRRDAQTADGVEIASAADTVDAGTIAPDAHISAKPWPRSLVPGASASGELTAGFGTLQSDALPPVLQPRRGTRFDLPPHPTPSIEAAPTSP